MTGIQTCALPISKAITQLRGYGLQTWRFLKNLSQLTTIYPNCETLYNNCRIQQDFGITNARFARQVSQVTGYPFHREILKLDNDEMILQVAGDEAVIAQRPNYLTDSVFKDRVDENPFHTKDDDDEVAPREAQRRYKRRKKIGISNVSEVDDLKKQLKEAIKAAKVATEETLRIKKELKKETKDKDREDDIDF